MKLPVAPEAVAMARLIKFQMNLRDVRQIPMAEHLGISQSQLSRKLKGELTFDVTELIEACKLLGMDSGELFEAGRRVARGEQPDALNLVND